MHIIGNNQVERQGVITHNEGMHHESLLAAAAAVCLANKTRKAARSLTARYEAKLRPVDLKIGQFSMLVALHILSQASVGTLAMELGMDRTTVNRNLKPLERDGLIRTEVGRSDGRTRIVRMTRRGVSRLERALPLWNEAQEEVRHELGARFERTQSVLDALAELGASSV